MTTEELSPVKPNCRLANGFSFIIFADKRVLFFIERMLLGEVDRSRRLNIESDSPVVEDKLLRRVVSCWAPKDWDDI